MNIIDQITDFLTINRPIFGLLSMLFCIIGAGLISYFAVYKKQNTYIFWTGFVFFITFLVIGSGMKSKEDYEGTQIHQDSQSISLVRYTVGDKKTSPKSITVDYLSYYTPEGRYTEYSHSSGEIPECIIFTDVNGEDSLVDSIPEGSIQNSRRKDSGETILSYVETSQGKYWKYYLSRMSTL